MFLPGMFLPGMFLLAQSLGTQHKVTYQTFVGDIQEGYRDQQSLSLSGKPFSMEEGVSLCFRINSSIIQSSFEAFLVIKHDGSIDEEWASIRPSGIVKFNDQLFSYQYTWETFLWHHLCLLYSPLTVTLRINQEDIPVLPLTHMAGR